MVSEIAWIEQLSQADSLSSPSGKKLGFLSKLEFGRFDCIESCASLERIYWYLDQIFWVGRSSGNPNPSLDLKPENCRKPENQDTTEIENLQDNLKGEDLESPETKWTNQLTLVKRISW